MLGFSLSAQVIECRFEGLKKIKSGYLLRTLKCDGRTEIDYDLLDQEMLFLKRMPGINQAEYRIDSSGKDPVIVIEIEESISILPDFDLRHADGLLTYRIGFQEFNFLGRGIQLKSAYQNNGKGSFFLSSEIPFLIGRFGFSGNFYSITSDEPFYGGGNVFTYELNQLNAEIAVNYRPDYYNRFEVGAGFIAEDFVYQGMEFMTEEMIPQQLEFEKVSYKVGHQFDTRKWNYFHVDGFSSDTRGLHIWDEENQVAFNELRTQISNYKIFKEKNNVGARVFVGIATNDGSPIAPFILILTRM